MRTYEPHDLDFLREKVKSIELVEERVDDINGKIFESTLFFPSNMTVKMIKDLKVNFDFENTECSPLWGGNGEKVLGFHVSPNGLPFLGVAGGGDWESPVFFAVYWDGKDLRAYIPTKGNTWNTDTKNAFGNDEESDLKNIKKRWPESLEESEDDEYFEVLDLVPSFDDQAILDDIDGRIKSKVKT